MQKKKHGAFLGGRAAGLCNNGVINSEIFFTRNDAKRPRQTGESRETQGEIGHSQVTHAHAHTHCVAFCHVSTPNCQIDGVALMIHCRFPGV